MKDSFRRWRTWAAMLGCISAAAVVTTGCGSSTQGGAGSGGGGGSSAKKPTIALTMTYTGNAWGQAAEAAFISEAKQLKSKGKISDYYTANANNSASTQSSQIEDFILKKVSAIIVEPASPTGLNGAIARAHAAGIPVVVIETGPVTSKYAYELNPNVAQMGYKTMQAAITRLHGKGNILYMQGVAGNPFTVDFKKGVEKAAKQSPGVHLIVGPFGNWTDTTSESALTSELSSLPKIDGLISEGGEGGAVQALLKAGRPVPVAIGDNYGMFMRWWWQEYQKTHHKYNTESLEANPWVGGAGAYVALDLAHGMKLPLTLNWPILTVTNPAQFKNISPSSVASQAYDQAWVRTHVEGK